MRILTYNVQGLSGVRALGRIDRVGDRANADVTVLNEVYRWPPRLDQPGHIAARTGNDVLFQGNTRHGPTDFGNAILSRHAMSVRADITLPKRFDPRGCLIADVDLDGRTVQIAATHLSLGRAPRTAQIEALAQALPRGVPLVLAGDMNCPAEDLAPLLSFMRTIPRTPPTFPSLWPARALDHILFSEHWTLTGGGTLRSLASDHLPLYADLELA